MSNVVIDVQEKLIKSKARVRDKGEVFTPSFIVKDMTNLIPNITIEMTFLEPSCGNGNFLAHILGRKLSLIERPSDIGVAVSSLFGIDIMADNVVETRQRLYKLCADHELYDSALDPILVGLLKSHIVHGDFLKMTYVDSDKRIWFLEGYELLPDKKGKKRC